MSNKTLIRPGCPLSFKAGFVADLMSCKNMATLGGPQSSRVIYNGKFKGFFEIWYLEVLANLFMYLISISQFVMLLNVDDSCDGRTEEVLGTNCVFVAGYL